MARQYGVGDEVVPGYHLRQFLGRGGFGEVWKADAPGGTEVAIKIIMMAGREGRKEFRALQRVKRIHHPNLTPILAFWLKSEDGQPIQETQSGISLLDTSEASATHTMIAPPPPPEVNPAELFIVMGLGEKSLFDRLQECREAGHDGIPPDELLGYLEDAAKGIDFLNQPLHDLGSGLVAIQHCDIKPHNLLIVGGATQVCDFGLARVIGPTAAPTVTAGSIAYAAPECLREGKPSHSSDQYSLAVSYVELRTGALPYEEETIAAVMTAAMEGRLHLSLLPLAEQRVIRRATSPDPDKRYPSASALVEALCDAVQCSRRRRPVLVTVAASLAMLAVAGMAALGTWRAIRDPRPVTPLEVAEEIEQPPDQVQQRPEQKAAIPHQDVARVDRPAAFQGQLKWIKEELNKPEPNYDAAISAIEQAVQLGAPSRPEYARAYLDRGTRELRDGQLERAIADFDRGVAHDSRDFRFYSRRGTAWFLREDWQKAAADFSRAAALDRSDQDLVNLGRAQQKLDQLDGAIASFRTATEVNPDNGDAHYLLAECHMKKRDYSNAVAAYSRAIEKRSATSDPLYDLAHAYFYRGMCSMALGPSGLDSADRDFARALQSPGKLGPIDAALDSLAAALAKSGRFADAAKWARKAAELAPDGENRERYRSRAKQYETQIAGPGRIVR